MLRGFGVEAYGLGVVIVAVGLSALQLFGAGTPAVIAERPLVRRPRPVREAAPAPVKLRRRGVIALVLEVPALAVVLPLGWLLVIGDRTLPGEIKRKLLVRSGLLFLLAAIVCLSWVFFWRLPA
jgi:hypothetical protein